LHSAGAAAAGYLVYEAVTAPLYAAITRRREADCDRIAFASFGEMEGFARWLARHARGAASAYPRFYATHPSPAARLRMAAAAAAGQPVSP
jgi:Zn-dependent protease with chaperone function